MKQVFFKDVPKLRRLYRSLEIGANRKMQSHGILELDPKRLRRVPGQKLRKHEMNQTFISFLFKIVKSQQTQRVCAKFYEQPFLTDKQGRLIDEQRALVFKEKSRCNLIVL